MAIETMLGFKIYLRQGYFTFDDDEKLFAILLEERLPDATDAKGFIDTVDALYNDLINRNIPTSPLNGKAITFLADVFTWPEGQLSDTFISELP